MVQERFKHLFFRYLTGESTPAEEKEFMEAVVDPIWESEKLRLMEEYFDKLPEDVRMEKDRSDELFRRVVGVASTGGEERIGEERIGEERIGAGREIGAGRGIGVGREIGAEIEPKRMGFRQGRHMSRWGIAASVAGIVLVAAGLLWKRPVGHTTLPAAYLPSNMIYTVNNTAGPMQLRLEDGSYVNLQPGSKLYYPSHFAMNKREVYLDGEAFFDIGKRPASPFMVYYKSMVTKVLGTSFTIRTDKLKKQVEVAVVSGKVLVCEINDSGMTDQNKRTGGVILNPNQKVIYKEEEKQFETTLVNKPVPVAREGVVMDTSANVFRFRDTPLSVVMKKLEEIYGIQIECGDDAIVRSLFTGDISSCDLYCKLDIICQSQNATYQIVGTKILIREKDSN